MHEGYYNLFFQTGDPVFYLLAKGAEKVCDFSAAAQLQGESAKV